MKQELENASHLGFTCSNSPDLRDTWLDQKDFHNTCRIMPDCMHPKECSWID